MPKIRIEYERDKCIGAGVCAAVDPENFVMNEDGKADLINSKKEGELDIKEMDMDNYENLKTAAEGCPVFVIKVLNKDTNEKIAGED